MIRRYAILAIAAVMALTFTTAALAQQLDSPEVGSVGAGKAKWIVDVTAGESGAPNGFTLWWMKKSTFDAVGGWFPTGNQIQAAVYFTGTPTLNTWDGALTSYALGPNQTARIEIGDLFDETGLTQTNVLALAELEPGVQYVFCAWALGDGGSVTASVYSSNVVGTTDENNCTYTQGYWKNHFEEWPVTDLTLGTVNYSAAELLSILNTPAGGNGLIALAHQLIATKLNIANGADPSGIASAVADADALIGGLVIPPVGAGFLPPSDTSALTQTLDDWNNGITGPGHCDATPAQQSTWGQVKAQYR